jgi:hypothetical protein
MSLRTKLFLTFVFGLAAGAAVVRHGFGRPPAPPAAADPAPALGAVPAEREGILVLKHLLESHPDGRHLKFLAWWPAEAVSENPLTREPAARVRVVYENARGTPPGKPEGRVFYVTADRVLGDLSRASEDAGLRYARVRPADDEGAVLN